jgi:hypothetical protein
LDKYEEPDSVIAMPSEQRLKTPAGEEQHPTEFTDLNYLSNDTGLMRSELAEDIHHHGYESNMTLGMGGENNFEKFHEQKHDYIVKIFWNRPLLIF